MRKFTNITAVVMIAVMLLTFCACGKKDVSSSGASSKSGQKTISVIAKGESNAFWSTVKMGCMDAGQKYGYKITFRGPSSESAKDLPYQKELVQTALSNGSSAIAIATIGEGFVDLLKQAYDEQIPVVQFDSGIFQKDYDALDKAGKNPIVSSIATDNKKSAAINAEHFYKAIKGDIANSNGYTVGIIQYDQTITGYDRSSGFKEKFEELAEADPTTKGKCKVVTEVKPGEDNNAYKAALEALYEKGANAIFVANEAAIKQVYNAINAAGNKYDNIVFSGFDAGSNQIDWMKNKATPRLVGSVAQDSYSIGYKTVEQAVFALEKKTVTEKIAIDGAWWDKTNVDEMMEKNLVYEG